MKNLYCILGASGSGKSTIAEKLEDDYGMMYVRSFTTRPIRNYNDDDHEYIDERMFCSWEEIEKVFHDIVARVEYDGHFYFTTAGQLDESDVYVIDPEGLEYLRKHYSGKPIKAIGLDVDYDTRVDRMIERGDNPENVYRRAAIDDRVFRDLCVKVDHVVKNDDLQERIRDIMEYVNREEGLSDHFV